jgi:ribose transport system permease protein
LVVSAFVGGLAGVIYLAQVGSSSQDAGPPFLLPTFAAVLLGATQIKPGRYNVLGTLVAVFLLAIGVKGLQLVGSPAWVSLLFDGAALVLAVALANLRRKPGTLIT